MKYLNIETVEKLPEGPKAVLIDVYCNACGHHADTKEVTRTWGYNSLTGSLEEAYIALLWCPICLGRIGEATFTPRESNQQWNVVIKDDIEGITIYQSPKTKTF